MSEIFSKIEQVVRIDDEATKALLKPNAQLAHALASSRAKGLPSIQIPALAGQFLSLQVQLMGAKTVLEIGTLGGYSAVWFAQAGAKVTSIEIDPGHRDAALENTRGLDVDVVLGAALDVLPRLAAEGRRFDFVFLDASWDEQWEYFQWAVKLTRVGGAIYMDNVIRAVIKEKDKGKEETLIDKVGREDKVNATLVSTVASNKASMEENFDGFLLAVVKK